MEGVCVGATVYGGDCTQRTQRTFAFFFPTDSVPGLRAPATAKHETFEEPM